MRKLKVLLFAIVFAMSTTGQAWASAVTLEGGTLGIGIGALPALTFPAVSSPILNVSSGGGSFTEPASVFTGGVQLPTALFTGVALISGLTIANLANGTKVVAQGAAAGPRAEDLIRPGGGFGGPGPLQGQAIVNVLQLFNLNIPLNVIGNSGQTLATVSGGLAITVVATGWTTGDASITGITTGNPATNTVAFAGYDNRDAAHHGVVQLVSAFKIITNAAGNLPAFATQTLTFVPEPGTILMLLSGVVTLGIGGWLRMRSR